MSPLDALRGRRPTDDLPEMVSDADLVSWGRALVDVGGATDELATADPAPDRAMPRRAPLQAQPRGAPAAAASTAATRIKLRRRR
jgi:hypothetical protein